MRLNKGFKAGVIAISLAAVVAGCGSSRSEEDPGGDDSTAPAAALTFGDLESPCGEGDASGATDQGVTDASIAIGYGDDRGFVSAPGLAQEVGDAVDAMVKWCNDQGGINGRELVGTRYDAAVSNMVPVMKEACGKEFMLVGDGFANDFAGDPVRVACELPHVPAYTVGGNAAMGELKVEPMPYPADRYNAGGLKAAMELVPEFKESIAIINTDAPATQVSNYKVGAALAQLGVTPKDCGITLHMAGDSSYAPLAQKLKGCGVKSFFNSYTPSPQIFGLLEANQQAGVELAQFAEAQWYGEAGAAWNAQTKAADGMLTAQTVQPLENADVNEAVAQYQELVEGNGGKTGMLGINATSAFLLWAGAAKECGDELTRDCVMEKIAAVEDWTAGGLQAPTNPGTNEPTECTMLVQLTGGTWEQVYPETRGEFACDPANVIDMDPAISGIKVTKDRTFESFLQQ
ncbi:ABC transporter substrate-binding protein [Nocardioides ochotonae]|uniref:ABC transporter substrate-binding protein n=1 Tax=Nocardioides ochotonae TaxID=2685869 RepID=UPI00140DBE7B|nr:ABC transporter substrate-binding protein [Nocardioides ochotonae]